MDAGLRYVLVALADNASDAGECYPSVETITRKTCYSERQVRRNLEQLAEQGWITVRKRAYASRGNVYRFDLARIGIGLGLVKAVTGQNVRSETKGPREVEKDARADIMSGEKREKSAPRVDIMSAQEVRKAEARADICDTATGHLRHRSNREPSGTVTKSKDKDNTPLPPSQAKGERFEIEKVDDGDGREKTGHGNRRNHVTDRVEIEAAGGVRLAGGSAGGGAGAGLPNSNECAKDALAVQAGGGDPQLVEADSLDLAAAEATHLAAVMRRCGFVDERGRGIFRTLEAVMRQEVQRGTPADVVAKELVDAWQRYQEHANANLLRFTVGPKKFFAQGMFRENAAWPYETRRRERRCF